MIARVLLTLLILFCQGTNVLGQVEIVAESDVTRLAKVLGSDLATQFLRAADGRAKVEFLQDHKTELNTLTLDRETGFFLAEKIMEGFPWREHYDDQLHQSDLFWLKDQTGEDPPLFSWLFVRLLKHEAPYVRLHAVMRLGEIGLQEQAIDVAAVLTDPDDRVRIGATQTLAYLHAETYAADIERLVDDLESRVRSAALSSLAKIRGKDALPVLGRGLKDSDPIVRIEAAQLLESIGDKAALGWLQPALQVEHEPHVIQTLNYAIQALQSLRGSFRPVDIQAKWQGPNSQATERSYELVRSSEQWARLWQRHTGNQTAIPDVDFAQQVVIAIFQGKYGNSRGIAVLSAEEDDSTVRIRFDNMSYQTMDHGDAVTPFGLFVIPRMPKVILLEENVQGLIGLPPVWKERARL